MNTESISEKITNLIDIPETSGKSSYFDGVTSPLLDELNDSTESSSFFNWIVWLLVILLLGFFLLMYLAKDPSSLIENGISRITSFFKGLTTEVIDSSAQGTEAVVDTTADTLSKATQPESKTATSINKGQDVNQSFPQGDVAESNAINKVLNSSSPQRRRGEDGDYSADDANSTIQQGSMKSGWCYIGEDRGYRACAEVGVNDMCMSGDIFPSHEICVNPKLRA